MALQSLSTRLQSLADTYKSTLTLIQRLQNLPSNPGALSSSESEPILELSSEIHQSLKEQEDELESLRQEAEDETGNSSGPFAGGGSVRRRNSEQVHERERVGVTVAKLGEDLRSARASFRKAQLEAKRKADATKRKERELLFANRSQETNGLHPGRRKGQEKLTQDELALNASSDVTAALRRTHALLQSSVEQSQFAQQTLNQSTEALASLSENYAGLDSLLKNSGGLVRQLIRSNKSDTWYLTTAFYILVVTLAWLVFRRILYGPMWWLLWQPLRLAWGLLSAVLAAIGIVGGQSAEIRAPSSVLGRQSTTLSSGSAERPTWPANKKAAYVPVSPEGGGWGVQRPQGTAEAQSKGSEEERENAIGKDKDKEKSLVEQIGEMAEGENEMQPGKETVLTDRREADGPPNPKKRMYEKDKEESKSRWDEL